MSTLYSHIIGHMIRAFQWMPVFSNISEVTQLRLPSSLSFDILQVMIESVGIGIRRKLSNDRIHMSDLHDHT